MRCWHRENGWSQTSSKTKYSVDKISSECWHCQDPGILRQDTCISFFDIVFFVVSLSDASSSSFVMLSFPSQQWGIPSARFLLDTLIKSLSLRDATLSTDSLRFPCNIAFIAVCDNCFAFSRRHC